MKRSPFIFALLFMSSCEDPPSAPKKPDSKAPSVEAPGPSSAPTPKREEAPHVVLSVAEFHSELATKGLSPVRPRVLAPEQPRAAARPAQLHFTKVEGGDATYCGTLSAGPIQCWGKEQRTFSGRFTDLALGSHGYCGVDLSGRVTCEKLTPPAGNYRSVAANGDNYCALGASGQISCFGPEKSRPQEKQRAEFIALGARFGCAADPTRRLVCWGTDAPLLPVDPIRVQELAAGATFVCALEEEGAVRCFGNGPRLPEGKYVSLDAGFETVCGVTTGGEAICQGAVGDRLRGRVRAFAIARASVCALSDDGTVACRGDSNFGQLDVPRRDAEEIERLAGGEPELAPRVDAELWLKFLEEFPSRELPLSFDGTAKVALFDRIPPEFEPLVGDDPNRYRSGVGFELAHGIVGVTAFDLEERVLRLLLFRDRRRIAVYDVLNIENQSSPETKPGGQPSVKKAAGVQALVTSPSTIEVSVYEGREKTSPSAKSVGAGSSESSECTIDKSIEVIRLRPAGPPERSERKMKRAFESKDGGCGSRFPFGAS